MLILSDLVDFVWPINSLKIIYRVCKSTNNKRGERLPIDTMVACFQVKLDNFPEYTMLV